MKTSEVISIINDCIMQGLATEFDNLTNIEKRTILDFMCDIEFLFDKWGKEKDEE